MCLGADKNAMASTKEQKEKSMLIALILFIGAAGLVFAYLGSEETSSRDIPKVVKSERFEKAVNRHLMLTNERMELERQRMAVENARLLNNELGATAAQKPYANENRVDLSVDNGANEVANDIGRGEKQEQAASPHDMIQRELFTEQQARDLSFAYKQEYARQFIENARKGGYQIKLSEDLSRVVQVRPIKQNKGMQIFEGGSAGN